MMGAVGADIVGDSSWMGCFSGVEMEVDVDEYDDAAALEVAAREGRRRDVLLLWRYYDLF
jgi:hypothetical protein